MTASRKLVKGPRVRDLDVWEALQERDFEYALNLLVAGEWVINDIVKDGWSSLDARVGSERCHETAALMLFARKIINNILADNACEKEFQRLVDGYRLQHASDKTWNEIFTFKDVHKENASRYNVIKQLIKDSIGPTWICFIRDGRSLASFSVLTNMECGLSLRYRRKGEVLVETSSKQRAVGMGDYHDVEFPIRAQFTEASFALIEEVANAIVGEDKAVPFGPRPRCCNTLIEQAREVFHFSRAYKTPRGHKQYPMVLGTFSASIIILLMGVWYYDIPITESIVRLQCSDLANANDQEQPAPLPCVTYKMTEAPVLTYVKSKEEGGCFKLIDVERQGIQKEPSWTLGGFSMYSQQQSGSHLCSADDAEFVDTLQKFDVTHRCAVFGFFHNQYPSGTQNGGIDLDVVVQKVCPPSIANRTKVSLYEFDHGLGLNGQKQSNVAGFSSLASACAQLSKRYGLEDTFIARQRVPTAKSSYLIQAKHVPFTYNHVQVSTPLEQAKKWGELLRRLQFTPEPMYANIFTIGNAAYSMSDQTEADALSKINSDVEKLKRLIALHPGHIHFLTAQHRVKLETNEKRK
ncbi:unnamed protein product [Sympodiomycopsis kandeliae]